MTDCTPEQLRFPCIDGLTVRAEFDGGALSSDFGPLLLRGVDRQIGLTERLALAFRDQRHASYIDHPLQELMAQRIYQVASGYEDANDANQLRTDPVFKLGVGRKPLDDDNHLASAPTFSRLENATTCRDLYRLAEAFVEQFVNSYDKPPRIIVLDMDHSEDQTHGQQELSFYNHHYRSYCYLPLFLFEGLSGKFITAALRPGKRPKGAENAMIIKRVLKRLRDSWPQTHIILRGDGHFSNPELMQLALDDNPRFVVTSLDLPSPECVYRDLYCARGQDENYIKHMKNGLASDRTSNHGFLANHLRLFFSCAAYTLHHTLRTETLANTELAHAEPTTVMLRLFKLAVRVVQYKDRVKLHLPSHSPVKEVLHKATELLFVVPPPGVNSS